MRKLCDWARDEGKQDLVEFLDEIGETAMVNNKPVYFIPESDWERLTKTYFKTTVGKEG
ncbi:hypothetical protein LCGC14_2298550 [marine sediment metagenome]|uniref:Uncharacterized protein n=1 Tax=marine sediment metagenome TaxID=412755 RepID=A0A0F9CP34_9ZZZZ